MEILEVGFPEVEEYVLNYLYHFVLFDVLVAILFQRVDAELLHHVVFEVLLLREVPFQVEDNFISGVADSFEVFAVDLVYVEDVKLIVQFCHFVVLRELLLDK